MTLSNKEWSRMSIDAVNYARAIGVTNPELADKLFDVFDYEYHELTKRMCDLADIGHAIQSISWYRIRKGDKLNMARAAVNTQKDVVANCLDAMRLVVDAMEMVNYGHK